MASVPEWRGLAEPAGLGLVAPGWSGAERSPTMTKLSETQSLILSQASRHEALLAVAPKTLPAAARQAVFRSMLKNGLLEELAAPVEYRGLGWRQDEDMTWVVLRITDDGLRAIGVGMGEPIDLGSEPRELMDAEIEEELALQQEALDADNAAEDELRAAGAAPLVQTARVGRSSLRDAATGAVAAWEAQSGLDEALEALKAALAGRSTAHAPGGPRKPRQGTKQEAVLTLLRRDEGATIAQVMEATGWAQHTVRGFFAGLKKKGHTVEVLERVRQVGPNKQGAKGSYSVYRVAQPASTGEAG